MCACKKDTATPKCCRADTWVAAAVQDAFNPKVKVMCHSLVRSGIYSRELLKCALVIMKHSVAYRIGQMLSLSEAAVTGSSMCQKH
jgi:hypothetical protein